jgi:NADP-dependent 3-hydroxy acid dehydrogenase YdfG
MELLKGRVALVVGADHAAGRATAAFLARAGAAAVLAGRDADALESLARDLLGVGGTAMASAVDPDDRVEGQALVSRTLERFGQLDLVVLFGDAGGILAAAAPTLAERGRGQVVLVAPPDPEAAAPAGAERAAPLVAAARRLAAEGRGHGVVVSVVRPGALAADLGLPPSPERLRPEDLAQAVLSVAAFAEGVRPAELVLVPAAAPSDTPAGAPAPGPGSFAV